MFNHWRVFTVRVKNVNKKVFLCFNLTGEQCDSLSPTWPLVAIGMDLTSQEAGLLGTGGLSQSCCLCLQG